MSYRIYIDESGTHSKEWLVIGMLFVPDHGALHNELCLVKDNLRYLNQSPKLNQKYKEIHFRKFRSKKDIQVAQGWIDAFVKHKCFYRAVIVDWSIFDHSHFGDPFQPKALKERRAYKKWAEMLLHAEVKINGNAAFINAELYLDKLKIMYDYDIIPHLEDRFTGNYDGDKPYIKKFQHTDARRDANQCLQLCDLLTSGLYQGLVPSTNEAKLATRDYLAQSMKPFGVKSLDSTFWSQYHQSTLRKHLPKFSAWYWVPLKKKQKRKKRKG